MKFSSFAIWLLLVPTWAYADSTLRASDLEKICSSSSDEERMICSLIVKAYKDGFIEGVSVGAMGVYKNDPKVFSEVKDVKAKDFAPRFNSVVSKSTCIQSVQVDDLAKTFVSHVRGNRDLQSGPFRTAMYRAIDVTYCKK